MIKINLKIQFILLLVILFFVGLVIETIIEEESYYGLLLLKIKKICKKILNKKNYYDELVVDYNNLLEYYKIISLFKSKKLLKTNEIITINEGQTFNQIQKETIIEKFKQPKFKHKIEKKNFIKIEIYFYKIFFGSYRIRLEIHMSERKLFYYNYTFPSNINNQQREEIIKLLEEKYLEKEGIFESEDLIIDKNQTILYIENSFKLKIHYANFGNNIFRLLDIYKDRQEKQKQKQNEIKQMRLKKIL